MAATEAVSRQIHCLGFHRLVEDKEEKSFLHVWLKKEGEVCP